MSIAEDRVSSKRHGRVTDARLAIKQAEKFIALYPAAAATDTVRNLKLALAGLLAELEQ